MIWKRYTNPMIGESYFNGMVLERGLSTNTQKAYRADLEAFSRFLSLRNITELNTIQRQAILDFLAHEKQRGLVALSLARRLVTLRVFFTYLFIEDILPENPTALIDSPELWDMLPEWLSHEDIDRLLVVPQGQSREALRANAILELLYASGLRVSELATLKRLHLHLDDGFVRITGKGNKKIHAISL